MDPTIRRVDGNWQAQPVPRTRRDRDSDRDGTDFGEHLDGNGAHPRAPDRATEEDVPVAPPDEGEAGSNLDITA